MGTKQQTTQATTFDPSSMQQYQQFWQLASPLLNSMATNPFGSSSYALNLAQATQASQQAGSQAMRNALTNWNTSMGGSGANSGVRAALQSQLARYGSNLNYQGFLGAANQAQQNQWNALGLQASRTPLVTGGQSTSQTSGLGTWLPQLASAAIGGATSAFTGGLLGGGTGSLPTTGSSAFPVNTVSQLGASGAGGLNSSGLQMAGYFSPGVPSVGALPTGGSSVFSNPLFQQLGQ